MLALIKNDLLAKVAAAFFVLITSWWLWIFTTQPEGSSQHYAFAATYGVMSIIGAFAGFRASRQWGGLSSIIGTSVITLSLGLLAQEFGQLVFSYYNIFSDVEIPYPSLADAGFFGSVLLYILGIWYLSRASGAKFSLNNARNQIIAFVVPVIILGVSYFLILRNYTFDSSDPLLTFFDFGYPLGEAIYISIALLTYGLSINLLGGVMRSRILLIVVAFIAQYIAECNFLLQNINGSWVNGGYGDYLYFLSYTVMTFGLIRLNNVLKD